MGSSDYLKSMALHNECKLKSFDGSPWCEILKTQAMRSRRLRRERSVCKKHKRSLITKRRVIKEGCKRPMNGIERGIRTLEKLVPNGKCIDLDGLFRETADFIMFLEIKVKIMQSMIKLLSPSDE